ncbi:MAG: MFS transporter [Spirosomataceae bacterium]
MAGFPNIASDFNVSVGVVSYSLASFFIGISLGQMLYGPLLDRFGRKLAYHWLSNLCFSICWLCYSHIYRMLIALRFTKLWVVVWAW